ncbi:MAG: hypothetical protein ACLUB5_01485 [Bifidobacterium dentium]
MIDSMMIFKLRKFEILRSSNYITILNITGISPISQGIVGTDHRGFLDVIDLPAPAAAVTGLRTTLADGAAATPFLASKMITRSSL